jgi:hypothetical protein
LWIISWKDKFGTPAMVETGFAATGVGFAAKRALGTINWLGV